MTTKIIAGDLAVAGSVAIDSSLEVGGEVTCNSSLSVMDTFYCNSSISALTTMSASSGFTGPKLSSNSSLILQIDKDSDDTTSVLAVTKNGSSSASLSGDTLLVLDQDGYLQVLGSIYSNNNVTALNTVSASVLFSSNLRSNGSILVQIDNDDNSTNTGAGLDKFIVTRNGGSDTSITVGGDTLLVLDQAGDLSILGQYNSFTGSHVYPSLTDLSDHAGAVVELVEGSHIELCSTADSKKVAGILVSCKPKEEFGTSSLGEIPESMGFVCTVAAVGDSRTSNLLGVKVCDEGGVLEPGDLLVTSSRAGYLKKQQDDIIRASTVAKVMQPVTFDDTGAATGVYSYVYCG